MVDISHYGSVVFNETAKAFFKVVLRNEDGTVWGKRLGRLVVLKRNLESTYGPERTVRYHWKELR